MGYRKLLQACCNYGCVGSYLPHSLTVEHIYSGGSWGPGWEPLNEGRIEIPYDNGPLSNANTMRCQWLGYWTPFTFAWLIERWCQDSDQTKFQVAARMDWPGTGAWAVYGLTPPGYFEVGPCGHFWEIELQDYSPGPAGFTPPGFIKIMPWTFDMVPLPPP